MSDNRQRPKIHRTDEKHDKHLRAYAAEHGIEPWKALEIAIARLSDPIETSTPRASLDVAAGVAERDAAEIKKLRAEVAWYKQRENDIVTACERVADGGQFRADIIGAFHCIRDERDAATRTAEGLRAELESAREATRRAEQSAADAEASTAAAVRLVERREAELAEAKRTADKLRIEVERVTEERDTERRLDVTAQEALRADVAREIEANKRLESELAEARAALETKGATDRLAERLETIAVDVDRRACACALPADLAPRLAVIAARRDVAPDVMLANVIKNGISKIEASDKYQDAQKAARARS